MVPELVGPINRDRFAAGFPSFALPALYLAGIVSAPSVRLGRRVGAGRRPASSSSFSIADDVLQRIATAIHYARVAITYSDPGPTLLEIDSRIMASAHRAQDARGAHDPVDDEDEGSPRSRRPFRPQVDWCEQRFSPKAPPSSRRDLNDLGLCRRTQEFCRSGRAPRLPALSGTNVGGSSET